MATYVGDLTITLRLERGTPVFTANAGRAAGEGSTLEEASRACVKDAQEFYANADESEDVSE